MLNNLKSIVRYKGRRVSFAIANTSDANSQVLQQSSSNESLVKKVATASKRLYIVCKYNITSSLSASVTDITQSYPSLDGSDHSTYTTTACPPAKLGDKILAPDYAMMVDDSSAVAALPAALSASAQADSLIATKHTNTNKLNSNLEVELESDQDSSHMHVVAKPKPGPLGLCRRIKAKYQKIVASMNSYGTKTLAHTNGETDDLETMDSDAEAKEEEEEFEDDTNDEEESIGQGPSHSRFEWKTIRAISNDQIELVARQHLRSSGNFRVTSRTSGTYNLVAFLSDTTISHSEPEYILRIPAHGTPSHWTQEDAYMLEREVQLMEHIRRNTKVPVAQVLTYCSNCNNELGSPYTLMTKLPGKSAYEIWFDPSYSPSDAFRNADVPSTATEKKRVNFLRSLARSMTELQALSFEKIGMPEISKDGTLVTMGPSYVWGEDEDDVDKAKEIRAFPSTRMYVQMALAKDFKINPRAEMNDFFHRQLGARKILNTIFSQPVFKEVSSSPETFTIHHNDLDLQNILVDDEGNVTGIIDWDKSFAAPRCIGASAVPIFLRSDWFPRYTHDILITPHMGWNEHYYRQIYAAAMVEAGNADAKYTLKSAIYQASTSALYEGGDYRDLIEKLVRYIPECRIDVEDLKYGLGRQWPAATEMLERELKKIFEPQLPCVGLLEDLDKQLALKEWWCGFDELLDYYEEEAEAVDDQCSDDEDEWKE